MIPIPDDTTTEEVLPVLIDKLNSLNRISPCRENALAITKMQEALFWLEARTKNKEQPGAPK